MHPSHPFYHGQTGDFEKVGFNRARTSIAEKEDPKEIYGIYSTEKPFDIREIIKRMVDNGEFEEYKEKFGQTIVCCYARIDGWAVGIVANQRNVVKKQKRRNAIRRCDL